MVSTKSVHNFSEGINWIETKIEAVIWKTSFSTIAFSQKQQIHIQRAHPKLWVEQFSMFHIDVFRLVQGHLMFELI